MSLKYSDLNIEMNKDIKLIEWNGKNIEVKQYLPVEKKLQMISEILLNASESEDTNSFKNDIKINLFIVLALIQNYTNVQFTALEKKEFCKLYDEIYSSGLCDCIINAIPKQEYDLIIKGVYGCAEAIYNYKNSFMGVLETVSSDYSQLDMSVEDLQKKLTDIPDLEVLQNVLNNFG